MKELGLEIHVLSHLKGLQELCWCRTNVQSNPLPLQPLKPSSFQSAQVNEFHLSMLTANSDILNASAKFTVSCMNLLWFGFVLTDSTVQPNNHETKNVQRKCKKCFYLQGCNFSLGSLLIFGWLNTDRKMELNPGNDMASRTRETIATFNTLI